MAECYFQHLINAAVLNLQIYLAMAHRAFKQLLNVVRYTRTGCIKNLSNDYLNIATALSLHHTCVACYTSPKSTKRILKRKSDISPEKLEDYKEEKKRVSRSSTPIFAYFVENGAT